MPQKNMEFCEPYGSVINDEAPDCPGASNAVAAAKPWVILSNDPSGPGSTISNGTASFYTGTYSNEFTETVGACGTYTLQAAPVITDNSFIAGDTSFEQTLVTGIYNAQISAFQDMLQAAHDAVDQNISYFIAGDIPNSQSPPPDVDVLGPLVTNYQTGLTTQIQGAMANLNDPDMQMDLTNFSTAGWLGAGAYFNRIARVQTDIMNAVKDGVPKTTHPELAKAIFDEEWAGANGQQELTGFQLVSNTLALFSTWLDVKNFSNPAAGIAAGDSSIVQQTKACVEQGKSEFMNAIKKNGASPVDWVTWLTDHAAACNGVWRAQRQSTPVKAICWVSNFLVQIRLPKSLPLDRQM